MKYTYSATITDVTDGDTIRADIDLGFNTTIKRLRIRLNRINAPEHSTPDGAAAALYLRTIALGAPCVVTTLKDRTEKYGRYLGEITIDGFGNLSDLLVSKGHAVYWDGHGARPDAAKKGGA